MKLDLSIENLRRYVQRELSTAENLAIEAEAVKNPELEANIAVIRNEEEGKAKEEKKAPPRGFKMKMRGIWDDLENAEKESTAPPMIHYMSKGVDFERWMNLPGMEPPKDFENRYSKEMGRTNGARTYLVWVKKEIEEEEHDNIIERFILLEGECNVRMGEKVVQVKGESYFEIPLHTPHAVEVTSEIPCKFICQRVFVTD